MVDCRSDCCFACVGLTGFGSRTVGLFVTCSCSGLLSTDDFEDLIIGSAHRHGRKLQILDRTGPGLDHPVMSNCPESRYLKVLWAIVV